MIDERTQELMSRYMDAQTSEEELAELNERIANDPEAADEFAMMARLHNTMLTREPALPAAKVIVFRERRRQVLRYATAAAVLLVLVAGLIWQFGMQGVTDGPEQPTGPETAVIEPGPAQWSEEFTFTRRIGISQMSAVGHEFVAVGSRAKDGGSEALLIGFHPDGTKKWSRVVTAGQQFRFYRMVADAEGMLAVGWYQGQSVDQSSALLVRFDMQGEIAWTRILDAADQEVAQWIAPATDGGWLICGLRANQQVNGEQPNPNINPELGEGGQASFVAHLGADGSVTWQRSIQIAPDKAMVPAQIRTVATADGGCLVAGATNQGRDEGRRGWIARLNADGGVAWEKSYGDAPDTTVVAIQDAGAAGFVTVMATRGAGSPYRIVRHAPDGSVTMQMEITHPDLVAVPTLQPGLIDGVAGGSLFVSAAFKRGKGRGVILVQLDGNRVARAAELIGDDWAAPSIDAGPDGSLLVTSALRENNGHRFSRTAVDALFARGTAIDVQPQVNADLVVNEQRSNLVNGMLELRALDVEVGELK
jgi:hypothetical protein